MLGFAAVDPHVANRKPPVWIAGVSLLLLACVDNQTVFGPCCSASAEETFSLQADAAGRTQFRLTGINGTVTIVGVSNTQTVLIKGIRRVEAGSQADADESLALLQVDVSQTAAQVSVRTTQPQNTQNRNFVVEYEVTLPAGLSVLITNVNGNVTVTGVANTVLVVNTNGNVVLEEITASADVDLVNGNIDARVTPPAAGFVTLGSVNGNVTLDVPIDVSAELSMTLTNGTLSVFNLDVQNQTSSSRNLTGTLGAGNGEIVLTTTNGNLSITGF